MAAATTANFCAKIPIPCEFVRKHVVTIQRAAAAVRGDAQQMFFFPRPAVTIARGSLYVDVVVERTPRWRLSTTRLAPTGRRRAHTYASA